MTQQQSVRDGTRPVAGRPETAERSGPRPAGDRSERADATEAEVSAVPDRGTVRLALTIAGLLLALLGGFALGRTNAGPGTASAGAAGTGSATADHTHPAGTPSHAHPGAGPGGGDAGGLTLSAAGYTLVPAGTSFTAGRRDDLTFRIQGPDRRTVTGFAVVHEKPMHLIVVRRDLTGYQHLHPTMTPDGTWSVPITLPDPGIWRAYADFTVREAGGAEVPLTLGVDLVVAGAYVPRPLPAPAREATVGELTVTYEGTGQVGASAPLLFRVFAGGNPVTAIEPYLGAYGHLVAVREGDLAYLHVHPEPELVDGAVKFWITVPSPGRYRLYLDVQVGGVVRTAGFTMTVD
ncbi:hypothetical protein [Micromonospora sp. HM5-17]|jgi:hypothetical protein|uniref:hypothetical protein n=1 Tax=Micromonospora sp. HM5-17 TaxID=2487710 RepID=UPI000F46A8AE|nr:hypothetical protein [Micromonospora sp. HM5-17]ROT34109.1 hypothetical protein EF879_04425 [Micromonospora sp. HM5-17]